MRKLIFTISIAILSISTLFAQNVSINETGSAPNSNSMLDINADSNHDKGLLIPRLTTAQRTGISGLGASDEGLTVYDTDTHSYWYWDGSSWVWLGQKRYWALTGNAGTTVGTNFLGTTDNVSLSFKTNNSERMRILNSGNIGIGTTSPSALLDVNGTSEFNGTMNLTNDNIINVNSLRINDVGDQEGILWTGSAAKIFVSPLNSGNSDGFLRLINDGGIVFEPGSEDTEVMTLTSGGNVGIGTTSPSSTLHVNGSTRMDGDFYNQQIAYDTDFSSTWASSSNNTWEDTDLSITITTHGSGANGSDVYVACNGSFSAYADNFGVKIVRDGSTTITGGYQDAYEIVEEKGQWIFSFEGIDSPGAGSHTYTVQIIVSDGSTNNEMIDATMTVMEIKK